MLKENMGRPRLELRDLRSLERRSMYSIFHPLDPNERLPRELILEAERHRQRHLEWLGIMYLPLLLLAVLVVGSLGVNAIVAFGLAGLAIVGLFVYVLTARYR